MPPLTQLVDEVSGFARQIANYCCVNCCGLYQSAERLTLAGFPNQLRNDLTWQTEGRLPWDRLLRCGRTTRPGSSAACEAGEGCRAGATAFGDRGGARRRLAGRSGQDRRHGPSDAAGLGDPVQRAGSGRSDQHAFSGSAGKLNAEHKAFLARIVDEGPIPAVHGVVRWRACDLIMRLHEEFGLSVSDDTVYRALKELGFSHVSARPKAYKQDADAMEAFKKTSPGAWRKSARNSHRAHR